MGGMVKSESGGLVSLLHGRGGELVLPKPFEKDIFLFDTHIAGTTHIEGMEELEPHLHIDDKLDFFREPDNRHDPEAVAHAQNKSLLCLRAREAISLSAYRAPEPLTDGAKPAKMTIN